MDYIKELELELERAKSTNTENTDEVSQLKAEIERLKTFEDSQLEFEKIKTQFYEEVVYADKAVSYTHLHPGREMKFSPIILPM